MSLFTALPCNPVQIPSDSSSMIYITYESEVACKTDCTKKNSAHVQYLNRSISALKEKLLEEEHTNYTVFLQPLESGRCVIQNDTATIVCECNMAYLIKINTNLEELLNTFSNKDLSDEKNTFISTLYFFKFHPYSASLYVSWLLYEYRLLPQVIQPEDSGSSYTTLFNEEYEFSDSIDIESQYGGGYENLIVHSIDDKGIFRPDDNKLFRKLFNSKTQKSECCNLNDFFNAYYNSEEIKQWFETLDIFIHALSEIL